MDLKRRLAEMFAKKREGKEDGGATIKIKVCHDTYQHELSVPSQSSFGELKRVLAQVTGLETEEQRLLFRGKEKYNNEERLHTAGVKDKAKIVLLEDPAGKARKLEKMNRDEGMSKAWEAIVIVRSEVDKLAEKVTALELVVNGGAKVAEKEFLELTELLMVQLLKLDGIEAEGEAKERRRIEARRIQSLVDMLDVLKAKKDLKSKLPRRLSDLSTEQIQAWLDKMEASSQTDLYDQLMSLYVLVEDFHSLSHGESSAASTTLERVREKAVQSRAHQEEIDKSIRSAELEVAKLKTALSQAESKVVELKKQRSALVLPDSQYIRELERKVARQRMSDRISKIKAAALEAEYEQLLLLLD